MSDTFAILLIFIGVGLLIVMSYFKDKEEEKRHAVLNEKLDKLLKK